MQKPEEMSHTYKIQFKIDMYWIQRLMVKEKDNSKENDTKIVELKQVSFRLTPCVNKAVVSKAHQKLKFVLRINARNP